MAPARRLLAWYRAARRDLPWRRTADPYAIWVSEVMLQQTRVAAAIPYFERFVKRFPDVGTLARARFSTVLAHWSGLGYYRRARHLHEAARCVARDGFPRDVEGWRALPGIGPYTSAAIASIAFGEPVAVVDGNVERVLCRLHALPGEVYDLAQAWLIPEAAGDFNQAVMELGALVCTPRQPRCDACPLRADCRGRDQPEKYPSKSPRKAPRTVRQSVGLAVRNGRVFLIQRPIGGELEGMWELPPINAKARTRAKTAPMATFRHAIMDRRILLSVHAGKGCGEGRWFTPARAKSLPLTGSTRKCLQRTGFLNDK